MSIRINTNTASMTAQRDMIINRTSEDKSASRLASGTRIVQAADDSAGLSISTNLNAHIRSTGQAVRNANDAISMVQVAEGGLSTIGDSIIRLRELAIQASSDTIGDPERGMLNREVSQIRDYINQIAQSTEFNGRKILSGGGSWPELEFQIGIHHGSEHQSDFDRRNFNTTLEHLGLFGIDFSTKENARTFLSEIDRALNTVNGYRAKLGGYQSKLRTAANELDVSRENLSAANSRIKDVDVASEVAENVRTKILGQASGAVLSQANQAPNIALKLIGAA